MPEGLSLLLWQYLPLILTYMPNLPSKAMTASVANKERKPKVKHNNVAQL